MTTLTTDIHGSADRTGLFKRMCVALWARYLAYVRRASRRDMIEALQAMSDAQLAGMGLKRHQIPHYVFRDLYYS